MNLSYLLKYLWTKKWVIVIPTCLAIITAWFASRNKKESYTSIAELSTGYMAVNPLDNLNRIPNNNVLFNNVIQTLKSDQVLGLVSFELLLHDFSSKDPFRIGKSSETFKSLQPIHGNLDKFTTLLRNKIDSFYVLDLAKQDDRSIRELAKKFGYSPDAILGSVEVRRIDGSDFIKVSATTENAMLSAFIANAICKTFLRYYNRVKSQASASSIDTLRSIVDTKKLILDNKLKMMQGGRDLAVSNSIGLLSNLQGQLTQQQNSLIESKVKLDEVNKQIADNGKTSGVSTNEEIIALRASIDNLWAKYVNTGSNDAQLLAQINRLRESLQQKLSSVGNFNGGMSLSDLMKQKAELEVKINVATQTIKDLTSKINSLKGDVQSTTSQEGVISGLQNEIEVARQEYINANNLYNEALNQEIFPGNNFKQSLLGSPPLSPNPSDKIKIIGFAGAGVFFLIIFLLLFFEFLDPSIKSPSALRTKLPFPLITSLQNFGNSKSVFAKIFNSSISFSKAKDLFRDQIKQLRFELERSGKKVFLITGYHPKAGKTTIVRSLAESISLTGRKVLIIDANFRNNTLSSIFNASPSLEKISIDGTSDDEIKRKLLAKVEGTDDDNIKILGCDKNRYTPDEIIPQNNILSNLKNKDVDFDYVLIECAALSIGPDAKEMLKYADAVVMVYAADNRLTEEEEKVGEFMACGTNGVVALGAVLNKVNICNMGL